MPATRSVSLFTDRILNKRDSVLVLKFLTILQRRNTMKYTTVINVPCAKIDDTAPPALRSQKKTF